MKTNLNIVRCPLLNLTKTKIVDVWAHNFQEEMKELSELLEEFNVVALDTEFPGVSYDQPEQDDKEYEYYQLVKNVQKFKLIQLGISIANEMGEVPVHKNTWQFHFKFNINQDQIMDAAKAMLQQAGIDFEELKVKGIDYDEFVDYCTGSGLILNDDIKYIVFHGEFDFGYLVQLFHHSGLTQSQDDWVKLLKYYFPQTYDLKYILKDNPKYKDIGLSKLAYKIDVNRIGPEHQAGSDALLTLQCYYQMKKLPEFEYEMEALDKHLNIIYGIGRGYIPNNRRKNYNAQTPDPQQLQQVQAQQQQQYYEYLTYEQFDMPYNYQQYAYMHQVPYFYEQQDMSKRKY